MKIPLSFNKDGTRIFVATNVKYSSKIIPVIFVVDTGSPETFIDEFETSKFRIFTKSLKKGNSMLMGGTKIDLFELGKVQMHFRDENNQLVTLNFDNLKVSQTAWTREGTIYSSTSLLGMNFLLENKLKLFVNPYQKEGYISDQN